MAQTPFLSSVVLLWMFSSGLFVFFMQTGFAMFECGRIQQKSIVSILSKNVMDMCVGAIAFWLVGHGIAYGCVGSGCNNFAADSNVLHFDGDYISWFFQYCFACTAATIVSGGVAERMQFWSYCFVSTCMAAFIYPVVAHWVWGGGWLQDQGVIDYAGGAVVHMTGGLAGLVGAAVVGPRHNVFEGPRFAVKYLSPRPFSLVFETIGVIFLWVGWYGFNCGSTWTYVVDDPTVAELVAVNTSLSGAAGLFACVVLFGARSHFETIPLDNVINGALAGLVAITPGCSVMEPHLALFTGIVAACFSSFLSHYVQQLKIDDPVDAFAVHYGSGLWGLIACGLFATPDKIERAFADSSGIPAGLFYGDNSATLLGWQLVLAIMVTLWVGITSAIVFGVMQLLGLMRVSHVAETEGCDAHYHGVAFEAAHAVPRSAPDNAVNESAFVHRVMSLLTA